MSPALAYAYVSFPYTRPTPTLQARRRLGANRPGRAGPGGPARPAGPLINYALSARRIRMTFTVSEPAKE